MLRAREPIATPKQDRPPRPRVAPGDPAADALRANLASGLYWLLANEPRARAGDPEGVHHLRTTTRRLRSLLRLFRPILDRDWSGRLGEELKWLADGLGAVRDLDVLRGRLAAAARELDAEDDLRPLFDELDARHGHASAALAEALAADRCRLLFLELARATAEPPTTRKARRPCRDELPRLALHAWKSLRKDARRLDADDPDRLFHDVRKKAKEARYAAEAVKDALDESTCRQAEKFARRARRLQDVLGRHQDAVVAVEQILHIAAGRRDHGPFDAAIDRLAARERAVADESRAAFFDAWKRLDRRKTTRWLHA